jgi:tripartite-type tricarboxylate transporter receptor subunit TctC
MNCLRLCVGVMLMIVMGTSPGHAQSAGGRVIRLVVPFAPGGSTDLVARLVADNAGKALGQPIIVENRPGASSHVGNAFVANAAADGTTLLFNGTGPLAIAMAAGMKLTYDPFKDLRPIGIVTRLPNVVTVNAALPIDSIKDLVAYGKANPDKLTYGMSAVGNLSHLNAEMFATAAGIKLTGVAYKGTGPLLTDLIGGSIQVAFDNLPPFIPHIRSGKIRALAVTSAQRSVLLPDVPALAEVGYPGFDHAAWFAIWGPAGLPDKEVGRLNAAFSRAIQQPDVVQQLNKSGIEAAPGTPEQLAARLKNERDQFAQVIKDAGIKLE